MKTLASIFLSGGVLFSIIGKLWESFPRHFAGMSVDTLIMYAVVGFISAIVLVRQLTKIM